jgi:hypothetical protein
VRREGAVVEAEEVVVADEEQVRILKQGPEAWNEWRGNHKRTRVRLSGANLSGTNLNGVNLRGGVLLCGANLSEAQPQWGQPRWG